MVQKTVHNCLSSDNGELIIHVDPETCDVSVNWEAVKKWAYTSQVGASESRLTMIKVAQVILAAKDNFKEVPW